MGRVDTSAASWGGAVVAGDLLGGPLGEFIERSSRAESVPELVAAFKAVLAGLGYDYLACAAIGSHAIYRSGLPEPVVWADYPDEWMRRYFENDYLSLDPVVLRAPFTRLPYSWDQLRDLSPRQQLFFEEAREAGLACGISVPLHGPGGELFLVNVAGGHPKADPGRDIPAVHLLATQFHSAYLGLMAPANPVPVQLTERERECLQWSARGKSSWDIGTVLSISENTVNFHIKNATAKLEASSRLMAIVKAIRAGLIMP